MDSQQSKLLEQVKRIPSEYFAAYPGGWHNDISIALVDAVFSMSARYEAANGKGVGGRVRALLSAWNASDSNPANSLRILATIDEESLRDIMGNGKVAPGRTSERYKSLAVKEAAIKISQLHIDSAEDVRTRLQADPGFLDKLQSAYTSLPGLGKVTFEYFLMLLGIPGVKADRMIIRFVRNALGRDNVGAKEARQAIIDAHAVWEKTHEGSLIELEHAIWRFQREQT